jgi:hypothetical protein
VHDTLGSNLEVDDLVVLVERDEKTPVHRILVKRIMKFRIVFWDVLPCKMIVDRRFRGACCLHHHHHP